MDYSQVCQGWIYCITNKINGKKYIGQTINYKERQYQHHHKEKGFKLRQAVEKYGWDNLEMKPILTFNAINPKVRATILNELEIFYIKKFNTYYNGYNSTTGGTTGHFFSQESRKMLSESHKKYCRNNSEAVKEANAKLNKPILQYDLNGRFWREYPSITAAAESFEDRDPVSVFANISGVLRGKHDTAEGYLWIYKESNDIAIFIDIPPIHIKPIYYYTKDNILIAEYKSINEASAKTGISINTIKTSLRKTNKGYCHIVNYWSRIAPTT